VVEYWIDADDVVFPTRDAWDEFARRNGAPELAQPSSGRTLWSHFESDEVRDVWSLIVARVRSEQAAATVPLRCDAPDMRRWFEMTITPGAHRAVHFRSALVVEEPRTAVAVLAVESARDRSAAAVPVCSWCGRGDDGSDWVSIEDVVRRLRLLEQAVVPPVAYGICPSCREAMSAELLVPAQGASNEAV